MYPQQKDFYCSVKTIVHAKAKAGLLQTKRHDSKSTEPRRSNDRDVGSEVEPGLLDDVSYPLRGTQFAYVRRIGVRCRLEALNLTDRARSTLENTRRSFFLRLTTFPRTRSDDMVVVSTCQ